MLKTIPLFGYCVKILNFDKVVGFCCNFVIGINVEGQKQNYHENNNYDFSIWINRNDWSCTRGSKS